MTDMLKGTSLLLVQNTDIQIKPSMTKTVL